MPGTLQRLWKDLYRRQQGDGDKPVPSRFQLLNRVASDLVHAILQIDSAALTEWGISSGDPPRASGRAARAAEPMIWNTSIHPGARAKRSVPTVSASESGE
jgi:hypothetical protein